jgi:K+-transporting ATPase KdpF subunit
MSLSCFSALFLHRFYTRFATLALIQVRQGDDGDRHPLSRFDHRVLCAIGSRGVRLREIDGAALVSWLYVLSAVIALVLAVYLVIALLFPEKF